MRNIKTRLRRNRKASWSRALVREKGLDPSHLVLPLFVLPGENTQEDIPSMPGVMRLSIDLLVPLVRKARDIGIPAVALFPRVPENKRSEDGREAYNPDNLVCRALSHIKAAVPEVGLIADVALDPYTTHGHDGLLEDGLVLNDATVDVLVRQALVQAQAGADILAPSDMMDGRVKAIRRALDQEGFVDVQILSYCAKYASCLYGPFRGAIGTHAALQGDKKTYQMDFANVREALSSALRDVEEGADMLMVKPGLPYLDVLLRIRNRTHLPVFAYQVSGEYAMLALAAKEGIVEKDKVFFESMMCFRRAGADAILTYAALDIAQFLEQ